jgi:hypothetical protein
MKRLALPLLLLLTIISFSQAAEPRQWEPRLALLGGVGIWSPKDYDANLYQTSLGFEVGLMYWYRPNNQIILGLNFVSLKTQQEYWRALADTLTFDVWDVKGSLTTLNLEVRQLFPADNINYLYLGVGGDLHYFGDIVGNYEIYGVQQPIKGTIREKRDHTFAGGLYVVPGMFFIFYKQVYVDIGLRGHWMYDGQRNTYWLNPAFMLGWRFK